MDAERITVLLQRRDNDMISFNIAININETTYIFCPGFLIFSARWQQVCVNSLLVDNISNGGVTIYTHCT